MRSHLRYTKSACGTWYSNHWMLEEPSSKPSLNTLWYQPPPRAAEATEHTTFIAMQSLCELAVDVVRNTELAQASTLRSGTDLALKTSRHKWQIPCIWLFHAAGPTEYWTIHYYSYQANPCMLQQAHRTVTISNNRFGSLSALGRWRCTEVCFTALTSRPISTFPSQWSWQIIIAYPSYSSSYCTAASTTRTNKLLTYVWTSSLAEWQIFRTQGMPAWPCLVNPSISCHLPLPW